MNSRVPSEVRFDAEANQIQLEAAEGDGEKKLRKFSGVAYTGTKVKVNGWDYPVVTDLAGGTVSKKPRPILRDHDTSQLIGHTENVEISARQLTVNGVISGANEHAREIIDSSDNGFPWQMSIGASVEKVVFLEEGESASVNGRKISGPVYIVRQWVLNEVSFVALGADDHTSAKVAASASTSTVGVISMTFDTWLNDKGFDGVATLSQKAQDSLKAQFDLEQKPAPPAPPPIQTAKPDTGDLDQIVARQKANENRVQRITMIAADCIQERPGQIDQIEAMARLAIDSQQDPEKFELELLRAVRPQTGGMAGRRKDSQVGGKVIEAAICKNAKMSNIEKQFDAQTLELADKHFPRGIGLVEVLLMAARENGCTHLSISNTKEVLKAAFQSDLRMGGFSTISLPGILGSVANKILIDAFNHVESAWRQIASVVSVRDFRQITSYSLTGGLDYEKVGASGDIKHGTIGDEEYNNQVETFGTMLAVTRRDLINDDLGAFAAIPRRLGRGGALAINREFWAEFQDNTAFFTTGRNNYDSGSDTVFDATGLTRMDVMFRAQTDPDGFPLGVMPRILLVPPAQRLPALRLMNSQLLTDASVAGSSNPFAGMFEVVSSQYLTGTAYYLLSDPADIPVIQVAFLNGREAPIVESADADFNTLGIQFRGYHDFGVGKQEYRGGVKFAGA